MLNRAAPALTVTAAQRSTLLTLIRSTSTPRRQVTRAQALLLAADGVASDRIAAELGVSPTTVRSWRCRFDADGLAQLGRVRPGQGAKPTISAETVEAIVWATLQSKPANQTHWSCQSMADQFGISAATVYRIWRSRGLKPHLEQSIPRSGDLTVSTFDQMLTDVVGGYLDPTVKVLALCMDDKSQVKSLGGSGPVRRMHQYGVGSERDDRRGNSTTTLFAAFDVLIKAQARENPPPSGPAILAFLSAIDREVPSGLAVRLVLDNDTTHREPEVQRWLDGHARFQLLFSPTTYSWLTLVERWFRELTAKAPRGSFNSVPDLISAIEDHPADSLDSTPFVWTSTAYRILEKVGGSRGTLKIAVGQ